MTTIKTTSKNYFNKVQKYLNNKRINTITSINNGVYTLTIFNLSNIQNNSLIKKMTNHLHLSPLSQPEPLALAA